MKLLLTSGGVKTDAIADALIKLAGAQASELSVAFIPTAANIRAEDKSWLIDDLLALKQMGFARLDIVDIAALPYDLLVPRLEQAKVIVFGGGSTQYLLESLRDKGLVEALPELLETRLLVRISAGSVMCCPLINPRQTAGLGYVDFMFVPHMGSIFATRARDDIQRFADVTGLCTYWVDDNSGVVVDGIEVRLTGQGIELVVPQGQP